MTSVTTYLHSIYKSLQSSSQCYPPTLFLVYQQEDLPLKVLYTDNMLGNLFGSG